jgi:hypothetical protein
MAATPCRLRLGNAEQTAVIAVKDHRRVEFLTLRDKLPKRGVLNAILLISMRRSKRPGHRQDGSRTGIACEAFQIRVPITGPPVSYFVN